MSAIDFDMTIERQADPKGDRVGMSMSGKFLPYKYHGATGNEQALGYKEEWRGIENCVQRNRTVANGGVGER